MNRPGEQQPKRLHREFGVVEVFCIASGAMISSGLFVLPGLVYAMTGPAAPLVYLLAGLLVIPTLYCKAELTTAMPRAGGDYFFIDRSLGAAFGTLGGIASWFSLSLKSAFALFGIGAFGLLLKPNMPIIYIKLIGVACCLVVTVINLRGTKHAGRLQIGLVFVLLLGLLIYILRGTTFMQHAHFEHFIPNGWRSVWAATGMVFVSYGGLTKVASVAEEVRDPGKTVPAGMFMAFTIITALYIAVVLVTVGILGPAMRGDLNPLIHGAARTMGLAGMIITGLAALLAYLSTANAGILSASRIPLAMSRDQLLPEAFARVDPRTGTPAPAIWITSLFMMAAILLLDLEMLVKVASTMKILLFLLTCLAVILMRESRIENYRPQFHTPLYPYLPLLGIIAYFFLLLEMGAVPLVLSAAFFGGGLLWYAFYGRIRVNRESALIRITKRIIPSPLNTSGLDEELREILQDRDGIVEDRFDRIIRNCPILDLSGQMDGDTFFRETAASLASRVDLPAERIAQLLIQREQESSTILKPGLAIPHIIIPGQDAFHIVLVRSREGIQINKDAAPVHAAFVLAGTEDVRNYHLRVLMFIAQITQAPDFEDRWRKARRPEALRDLILLAKRTREQDLNL
jgi:amino acid transporter/mannitol/fructose-specific phosphotransferase system IIA component (Ntr-type)